MENAVEKAIACMWARYSGPLTLAEMAASARLSRFYFTRLFKEETGITPGRFLAAVRIHQAKRLIESTSLSITEVSYAVGYNSLGSFTNSFTAGVGVSPSRFRRLASDGADLLPQPSTLASAQASARPSPRVVPGPWAGAGGVAGTGAVAGTVRLPEGFGNARVFIGAFRTAVVQYPSLAQAVVDVSSGGPSCYSLEGVPAGSWHLLAVAVADGVGDEARARRSALVGGHGPVPVTVAVDGVVSAAVSLRRARPTDPPVLLALPELEPPATVVPRPGCASVIPEPERTGRRRAAGRLSVVPAAPTPS